MADVLTDLAAHLATGLGLVLGTDLFGNDMPDAPDALTVLYETPGSPPIQTLGADGVPAVILPRVMVQTRAATHDASRARARAVYNAFVLLTNETVNGAYYLRVSPVQEPFLLNRDEKERPVFSFTAEVLRAAE